MFGISPLRIPWRSSVFAPAAPLSHEVFAPQPPSYNCTAKEPRPAPVAVRVGTENVVYVQPDPSADAREFAALDPMTCMLIQFPTEPAWGVEFVRGR